jgi:DNA-binding CsgD family transcriptional regulator
MRNGAEPDADTSDGPPSRRSGLIGRDAEISRLLSLIDSVPATNPVLVVLGEAGMGKTALLSTLAEHALSRGMQVLSTVGRESEANLSFAALYELLKPLLAGASQLSERQAVALRSALGIDGGPAGADQLVTGMAALTLLSDAAEHSPMVIIIDDAHWIDQSSLNLLSFVAHRIDTENLILVFGARESELPLGFDRTFPEFILGPLSFADANLLLDGLGNPPRGESRDHVLHQSVGVPLALTELSEVIAADPSAGKRWSIEPLPPGSRLGSVYRSKFISLPDSTRAALILAAVADSSHSLMRATEWTLRLEPEALAPAEELGLIKVGTSGIQFSHPLIRAAIYHAASFSERATAHRRIAESLDHAPDRRAWHLAAATVGPDEEVAILLERTATDAQRRGGLTPAAMAMERAAELSPDRNDQAKRLVVATTIAVSSGRPDWVQDLAMKALERTDDPGLRLTARRSVGWVLAWSPDVMRALSTLVSVAKEASAHDRALAWSSLGLAAGVQFQTGGASERQLIKETYEFLAQRNDDALDTDSRRRIEAHRLYIRAAVGTIERRDHDLDTLRLMIRDPLDDLSLQALSSAAWVMEETDLAVTLLNQLLERLRAPEVRGSNAFTLSALGWALIAAGRWDEALEVATEMHEISIAYRMDLIRSIADLIHATILAYRGETESPIELTNAALARVDPKICRSAATHAHHAVGLAALGHGDNDGAFSQLSQLFTKEGDPLHHHKSFLSIADLATAAARSGRRKEGRGLLEVIFGHYAGEPVARIAQLRARALGVLSEPEDAEHHFAIGISDQTGNQWPFERAQLHLEYGEWLRRRKRKADARINLTLALGVFERLRAAPHVDRTQAELRACGVPIQSSPDVLAELTPQERQIVRLAARGLTNREIGDRLYLSPRTVGSHLYRSFPKLGVSSRHDLNAVVPPEEG